MRMCERLFRSLTLMKVPVTIITRFVANNISEFCDKLRSRVAIAQKDDRRHTDHWRPFISSLDIVPTFKFHVYAWFSEVRRLSYCQWRIDFLTTKTASRSLGVEGKKRQYMGVVNSGANYSGVLPSDTYISSVSSESSFSAFLDLLPTTTRYVVRAPTAKLIKPQLIRL